MPKLKTDRESLADQVADSLRDHIYNTLEPDDLLPSTATLVAEYDVSRIVVREALKTLEAQDIIEVTNGKRAKVKPLSANVLREFFHRATLFEKKTLLELLEVRRGIEIESAGLAAVRRSPEEVVRMKTIIGEMEQCLSNPQTFADLDLALHQTIAKATRNSMLIYLIETVREAQTETILEGLYARFSHRYFVDIQMHHVAIVNAIEAQYPAQARQAMADHFVHAEKTVGDEISTLHRENKETSEYAHET